jgi:hypothetical protein
VWIGADLTRAEDHFGTRQLLTCNGAGLSRGPRPTPPPTSRPRPMPQRGALKSSVATRGSLKAGPGGPIGGKVVPLGPPAPDTLERVAAAHRSRVPDIHRVCRDTATLDTTSAVIAYFVGRRWSALPRPKTSSVDRGGRAVLIRASPRVWRTAPSGQSALPRTRATARQRPRIEVRLAVPTLDPVVRR